MCESHEEKVVSRPGKFEGEPAFVHEFWGRVLNGEGTVATFGKPIVSMFVIEKEDMEKYPEQLGVRDRLYIWEDNVGFVRHVLIKRRQVRE